MDIAKAKTHLNKEQNRFELKVDNYLAFIDFKTNSQDEMYITHTEVPAGLEGRGVGHKLVRESLSIIENEGCLIIPLCPFVRSFIMSNKEDYQSILSSKAKLP